MTSPTAIPHRWIVFNDRFSSRLTWAAIVLPSPLRFPPARSRLRQCRRQVGDLQPLVAAQQRDAPRGFPQAFKVLHIAFVTSRGPPPLHQRKHLTLDTTGP